MTAIEQILRIPRSGVEHEYRWFLDKDKLAAPQANEELRDELVHASGLHLDEQASIRQHTLCFDSIEWSLTAKNCSLTALLNCGDGPSWLVAKETIQWDEGRRDVLEITDYISDIRQLSGIDIATSFPGRYLARRVDNISDLRVFGYLSQQRTKATLRTDNNALVALSCDAVTLRDTASRPVDSFSVVELEVNQAGRYDLDLLSTVAQKFSAVVGRMPCETTKPRIAAEKLGWNS